MSQIIVRYKIIMKVCGLLVSETTLSLVCMIYS